MKANSHISVTHGDIVNFFNDEQPLKTFCLIEVFEEAADTWGIDEKPSKDDSVVVT